MMALNTDTIVRPRLHHLGLTTSDAAVMVEWYGQVLGMTIVHATDSAAAGHPGSPRIKIVWLSNDEANHRLAIVEVPGAERDLRRSRHSRIQHFAFEYRTLGDLLGTYLRLKSLAIAPVLCTDAGSQTAFYYEDPDGNSVELNVDNFENPWTSGEYVRNSPDFAGNPLGVFVDPDKLVAGHALGARQWDLHVRARAGEFAPDTPYDLTVLV